MNVKKLVLCEKNIYVDFTYIYIYIYIKNVDIKKKI
jgi:hypothetical protein